MGANFASVLLFRLVPRGLAFQLLYTGEPVTAAQALSWGLVNQVVPAADCGRDQSPRPPAGPGSATVPAPVYKEMAVKGWDIPVPAALRLNAGPNPYTSKDREEGVGPRSGEARAPMAEPVTAWSPAGCAAGGAAGRKKVGRWRM